MHSVHKLLKTHAKLFSVNDKNLPHLACRSQSSEETVLVSVYPLSCNLPSQLCYGVCEVLVFEITAPA